MTASEARELMQGSMKCKGWIFRMRLAWFSGIINSQIEKSAEDGDGMYTYAFKDTATARKYAPLLIQAYEELDYSVIWVHYYLSIIWDTSVLDKGYVERRLHSGDLKYASSNIFALEIAGNTVGGSVKSKSESTVRA